MLFRNAHRASRQLQKPGKLKKFYQLSLSFFYRRRCRSRCCHNKNVGRQFNVIFVTLAYSLPLPPPLLSLYAVSRCWCRECSVFRPPTVVSILRNAAFLKKKMAQDVFHNGNAQALSNWHFNASDALCAQCARTKDETEKETLSTPLICLS